MSDEDFKIGFELTQISISLENILPVRPIGDPKGHTSRYVSIVSSIKEVGLVEPLVVYPQRKAPGKYILVDGHLRFYALKELGNLEAACIVSTDDESYTYNARVSRLSPIQEHSMIIRAIKNGVPPQRIANALNKNVKDVRASINILEGIAPEVVEMLKTRQICNKSIRMLKRVTPLRQIEMAEIMIATNNFGEGYVGALLHGTKSDMLAVPQKAKKRLSPEDVARMEFEMESIEKDFKGLEESYGETVINLTVAKRYITKLIENTKVQRFLSSRYPDILPELQNIAEMESI